MYAGINGTVLELILWKKKIIPILESTLYRWHFTAIWLVSGRGTFINNINMCLKWQASVCKVYLSLFNAAVYSTGYCTNYRAEVVIFHSPKNHGL